MAGSASYQKAMARPTSQRQKARVTTSEHQTRGNSELASAQLPPYQSPTGWICRQTLSVARRDILTFAQNTRCPLCARSRPSQSRGLPLLHQKQTHSEIRQVRKVPEPEVRHVCLAAMFPREQLTASTDFVRDADIFARKYLAAHLRNNITSDKFAERNGSSVFLCPSGGGP